MTSRIRIQHSLFSFAISWLVFKLDPNVPLNVHVCLGESLSLNLNTFHRGFLGAEGHAPEPSHELASVLALLHLLVLFLLHLSLSLSLFSTLLLLEDALEGLHLGKDNTIVGDLRELQELEDLVDVGLNLDEQLGWVDSIGTLGSLLVADGADFCDLPHNFGVDAFMHKLAATTGCLGLKVALLCSSLELARLVLVDGQGQRRKLPLLDIFHPLEIFLLVLSLLLVFLPLLDQGKVILLEFNEVPVEFFGTGEGQVIALI